MQIIDGKAIASEIRKELKKSIESLPAGNRLNLVIFQIGDDSSSITYAESLAKSAAKIGIECKYHQEKVAASRTVVRAEMLAFAEIPEIHGLLMMRPVPSPHDELEITRMIIPEKDIDCANPLSMGLLATGRPKMLPPTPAACVEILKHSGVDTAGKLIAIVGRSNVVGKPLALMLARKGEGDATVILCHSRTKDLAGVLRNAEIVIAAAGVPKLITADMISKGAVVIDAGINWTDSGMVGDVDFENVREKASMITPVPGGVGPVTRMMLFRNLLHSYKIQKNEN